MTRGIKIATTDLKFANPNQVVVDSTKQGSWKVSKPVTLKTTITRASGGAVTQILSADHDLGFAPAYLAFVDRDIGAGATLYNIPYFDTNSSYKVYVDKQKVYVSIAEGLTGTFNYTFRIKLLGEKIE